MGCKSLGMGLRGFFGELKGPTGVGPFQPGTARRSFIALLFIKPVFRTGQALRPVVQMEIAPPSLGIGLVPVVRRFPWEISPGFPWPSVLLAHRGPPSRHGAAPCGTDPRNALPRQGVSAHSGPGGKSRAHSGRRPPLLENRNRTGGLRWALSRPDSLRYHSPFRLAEMTATIPPRCHAGRGAVR